MSYVRKIIYKILPIALVILCLVGFVIFAFFQTTAIPYNPLSENANSSQMVLPIGENGLNVDDDILNTNKNADINNAHFFENTVESSESHKETQQESTMVTTIQNDNSEPQEETSQIATNTINQVQATEKPEDGEFNQTNPNKTDNGNLIDESLVPSPSASENYTGGGNSSQPTNEPSTYNPTDITYFTTSINDGETVSGTDYKFQIFHKQSQLTVKSESIYVNSAKVIQFKGNVLLQEGKNTIRISVVYTDEKSKVISIYKDYTVYVDLGNISIVTDLKNQTLNENLIRFNASALFNNSNIPVIVTCNNRTIKEVDGLFTAVLISGENTITISAKSGSHNAAQSYTITFDPPNTFSIYTSLFDNTVNNDSMDFDAYIINGSEKSRLTVVCNGTTINGTNNQFNISLKVGNNSIRLKATDTINKEKVTITKTITIKYVPLSTSETAPYLKYINVTDNMSITGSAYTLNVQPVDYLGNRIYFENITVYLNGSLFKYTWATEYTSYLLYLQNGKNTLDIRITDSQGRYVDYSFIINCTAIKDGDPIGEITISIDANVLGLGYILQPVKMTVYQGESAAKTITRFLEEKGFSYEYNGTDDFGFYISRLIKDKIAANVQIPQELIDEINNDGLEWKEQRYEDSIGEFDYCQGSGWLFTVNDAFPGHGLTDSVFKDGDTVKIRYTLAYGKDIGGYTGNDGGKNYDKTW